MICKGGGVCPEPIWCGQEGECLWDRWNKPDTVIRTSNEKVATPGATFSGEDSVSHSAESSRPRELLTAIAIDRTGYRHDWAERCSTENTGCERYYRADEVDKEFERLRCSRETFDGRPPVPGLRYDVVGWACSVCGAWNDAGEDFCAHPKRPKALLAGAVAMARAGAAEDLKDLPRALKASEGQS